MDPTDCGDPLTFQKSEVNIFGLDTNALTTIVWIDLKYFADIHGPQKMNLYNFGDHTSVFCTATLRLTFLVQNVTSRQLYYGLLWNLLQIFMFPRG